MRSICRNSITSLVRAPCKESQICRSYHTGDAGCRVTGNCPH
jgi:hypothetical protein